MSAVRGFLKGIRTGRDGGQIEHTLTISLVQTKEASELVERTYDRLEGTGWHAVDLTVSDAPEQREELLTDAEHEIIDLLGRAAGIYSREVLGGDENNRYYDLAEFVHHVHLLQHAVMAQAAARAYPARYRLAGDTVRVAEPDDHPQARRS